MDEQQKDLYDRFGPEKLNFDPRKDELKLLSDIAFRYVYWFVLVYVITIPETSRASRTWDIFVCIGMMIAEVTLCLTESKLPTQVPLNLTEFEMIELLHALCPTLIALLSVAAEYVFVDVDKQCAILLSFLAQQQRDIDLILLMLTPMVEEMTGETTISPESLSTTKYGIAELQDKIRLSQRATAASIDVLKNSNSNFLSKYYWVIFVLMYFGVYLFQ